MVNADHGSAQGGHLSRLLISKLLAGIADGPEQAGADGHLLACAQCAKLLSSAKAQAALFSDKYPSLETLSATRASARAQGVDARSRIADERMEAAKARASADRPAPKYAAPATDPVTEIWTRIKEWLGGGFGVRPALATLLILGVAGVLLWVGQKPPMGDLTAKGGASGGSAAFYLFLNGKQVRGDSLGAKPSDTLQLGITSPSPVYYAVLYQDDFGDVRAYLGGSEQSVSPLGNPKGENLPNSLVLDGNWKRESLFCLWSDKPFSLEEAKRKVYSAVAHSSERAEKASPGNTGDTGSRGADSIAGKALHLQTYKLGNGL